MGDLVLVRHGETEWSKAGRHTGLTDLPLTAHGEGQARALGELLAGRPFALVLTSPLQRARRTAALAGLTPPQVEVEVDPDLVEWDYGGYEGMTSAQIQATGRPDWRIFDDGVVPGSTPGETLSQVVSRVERVIARVRPVLAEGDVAVVAHGHALRVLATVWLGRPAELAAQLLLAAGSVSELGQEHGVPAIVHWNLGSVALDG
jgi:broad specificity phosphatase PhoE